MATHAGVPLLSLALDLSRHLDLAHPALRDHHQLTAFIAREIARRTGVPEARRGQLVMAALLHDVGALTLKERLDLLEFEHDVRTPGSMIHARAAAQLLGEFPPFKDMAHIVAYHHVSWNAAPEIAEAQGGIPPESHILHLADRVAVLLRGTRSALGRAKQIRRRIRGASGTMFAPQLVDAFDEMAETEAFWLQASDVDACHILAETSDCCMAEVAVEDLKSLAKIFGFLIDFKSPFTAFHSGAVAATAEALARRAGLPGDGPELMGIAGHLHDVGKMAVPARILEKPKPLTAEEFNVMRGHAYYTYKILEGMSAFGPLREWAAYHHERPDGKGYPFHLSAADLSTGARLVAVADVYVALRENRPYKAGLDAGRVVRILAQMGRNGALDRDLVALMAEAEGEVDAACRAALPGTMSTYERVAGC